uniref:YqaJ viral recombinase domain-containing protein n=1 Tax=viral metagenome TaxID=1070528 RepID=A0A6C0BV97_9ZZZZ
MFDEIHYTTISVIISIYNRFFPEKCDDEQIREIIEYTETSTDNSDLKKQNIYSMISEMLYDENGQKTIYDMIDAVDLPECPPLNDIKELLSIIMVLDESVSINYGKNEFIQEDAHDHELLREITEVITHNNPTIVAEPKYKEIMKSCVREHFDALIEDEIVDEDDFEEKLERAIEEYYKQNPRECIRDSVVLATPSKELPSKLAKLRDDVQPEQRTTEWYERRHGLITASSAWKVLDSQANFNSFVHSKCVPYQPYAATNVDSPLHWGQRYEPVSVELYEHLYNTKLGEFGCITHPAHEFLGASPDGINIDSRSPLYGRMLEIKNIVNREITGIPKKEYWIQMQLQMEVCDLADCDFLECVFKEYPSYMEFYSDVGNTFNKTASGAFKGVLAMFYQGSSPVYEYCPLVTTTTTQYERWMEDIMERNSEKLFVKYIYWRLELMSCVYVPRNREWFLANVAQLRHAWETIQREKVSGFDHRKPIKKTICKKGGENQQQLTINITTNIDHLDEEPMKD